MKTIILLIVLILFAGCSKQNDTKVTTYEVIEKNGVKTVLNKNEPSDPNFGYNFTEVFSISGIDVNDPESGRSFHNCENVTADREGSIYIVDRQSNTIKKFDKNGKYLLSFGRKGSGPGEYNQAKDICAVNDTVFVFDPSSSKVIKFDLEGNHLYTKVMSEKVPVFTLSDSNSSDIIGTDIHAEAGEGKVVLVSSISKYDCAMNKKNDFSMIRMNFDPANPQMNPMDFMATYTYGKGKIFIGDISEDKVSVKVYDLNGSDLYNFTRNYIKVKLTDEELKKLSRQITVRNDNGDIAENVTKEFYKKALNGLWLDKYGRLWALTSIKMESADDKTLYFDIFEEGKYLNRIKLDFYEDEADLEMNFKMKLIGNRLYLIDNREDLKIRVFDYSQI